VAIDGYRAVGHAAAIRVAVPVFSRIANFDDLDPLIAEPDVAVDFVQPPRALPGDADLIVLPGSKATLADLAVLRKEGWDVDIAAHVRRGGIVLGLCGGFQMLGRSIRDPQGIEGSAGLAAGLGLIDIETEIASDKRLAEAEGVEVASGEAVHGYEMHNGLTVGPGLDRPMLRLGGAKDGAVSADGRVYGCYLHGLFGSDGFRHTFLNRIRMRNASGLAYESEVETVLDALAGHLENHLNLDRLLEVAHER
jgi:adenosylcobyric acid synthase